MRTSPLANLVLGLAVISVVLTGCATGAAEPAGNPAAAPPTEPSATSTAEPIVVGPAEMPPVAFDGDCAQALSIDEVSELLEVTATEQPVAPDEVLLNLGGLTCRWSEADDLALMVHAIPRAGLDGAELPAEFDDMLECPSDPVASEALHRSCAWEGGDDELWLGLVLPLHGQQTAADIDEAGTALAERILERHAASGAQAWVRDRSTWWPSFDCAQVATALSAELGEPVDGQVVPWDADLAPIGRIMKREAGRLSDCSFAGSAGPAGSVHVYPGLGGGPFEGVATVDLGIPGITAYEPIDDGPYIVTDGVNRVEVWSYETSAIEPRDFVAAIAAAAASDFQ